MAKELPYFRFTVQDWQNGKISIESFELQGLFISACGYYWINDCDLTLTMLKKKFSNATNLLDELVNLGIIKHEKRHDKVEIVFLNEQYDLLSEKRKARQNAGSKGGNAKAMLKQKPSYKDKDKDKYKKNDKDKSIETKISDFYNSLIPFTDEFGQSTVRDFFNYWSEPNQQKTKQRFEMEKTWDTKKRLATWKRNESKFKPAGSQSANPTQNLLTIYDNLKDQYPTEQQPLDQQL